jgi:hypothetical protein
VSESFSDISVISCGTLSLELNHLANENFPRHSGGAIVLDGVGYMETYMEEHPEDFLEYCDWMGIPMIPYPVTLDRLKALLLEQAQRLHGRVS